MQDIVTMDLYGRWISDDEYASLGRRCRYKGGGSTTVNNTSTYTPTEYELQLQKAQSDYANAIAPNSLWLNDTARNILQNSIGAVQVDFNSLNNQSQNQIKNATQGLSGLTGSNTASSAAANRTLGGLANQYTANANNTNSTLGALANGQLPTGYQNDMQASIASALKGTMGNTLNGLAQRGVLNSSVTNKAMSDISNNAANAVAQQYQNNIQTVAGLTNQQYANTNNALGQQASLANQQNTNTLNANNANANIYGNLVNSATSGTTAAAAAQEAAQQPAINLWNASLGLNGATTGALAAAAGKGTTTSSSTQKASGGGGLLSGLLGGIL